MKRKNIYWIINFILVALFLTFFFSSTICVPVENIVGSNDPSHFILGGFYCTSGLFQLQVGNYVGVASFFSFFLIPSLINYFYLGKNEKKK